MFANVIGATVLAATLHEHMQGWRRLYAFSMKSCDPIFATGGQEARRLAEVTGKTAVHLPSAPSEVFFSKPRLRSEPVDVIVAGSLIPRKNVELVLEIAQRKPHLSIAIFGGGSEHERLEEIRALKGLNNVRFPWPRGTGQYRPLPAMCSSRLFLNTALAEGSPTTALEAMACGLPVVLTPSNDYSEIVDQGVNGRVTAQWDADELVKAIDEFLEHPERLAKAGKAAQAISERHRWAAKARIVTNSMIDAIERNRESR